MSDIKIKIHFIGTSDGYPEKDRFCSCTVVTVNQKHYVIDAGVSLYSALLHNGYEPQDVKGVFITHMHGDHSSGLVEFVNLMAWGRRAKIETEIFVPTLQGKLAIQNLSEAMDNGREVDMKVFKEGLIFQNEDVCVTAFRTKHNQSSFGFLIEAGDKRVYFTGDMQRDINDCPEFVYSEKTDLIVCESAHNRLMLISDKLNNMKTEKLIINHIAAGHSVKDFEECKGLINKPFILAYDGMKIEI